MEDRRNRPVDCGVVEESLSLLGLDADTLTPTLSDTIVNSSTWDWSYCESCRPERAYQPFRQAWTSRPGRIGVSLPASGNTPPIGWTAPSLDPAVDRTVCATGAPITPLVINDARAT